jgi:DNA-binding transcriptional MerR regulator
MRIGELSRRTGVSPELLRAWEQRYGLLRPERSPGGFRMYSEEGEARVRRTTALIAQGVPAAEAARQALSDVTPGETGADRPVVELLAQELQTALDRFDSVAANDVLDRLFGAVSVDYALKEVLIPYLHELGERWTTGAASVAQEHFASHLIRGRLLGLAGDWGAGRRDSAVLACLPGEAHDLGLVILSLLLTRRGWRVTFLGADTPLDTLEASVPDLSPALVVLGTYQLPLFRTHQEAISQLASRVRVAVYGPLPDHDVRATGAELLPYDMFGAAEQLRVVS